MQSTRGINCSLALAFERSWTWMRGSSNLAVQSRRSNQTPGCQLCFTRTAPCAHVARSYRSLISLAHIARSYRSKTPMSKLKNSSARARLGMAWKFSVAQSSTVAARGMADGRACCNKLVRLRHGALYTWYGCFVAVNTSNNLARAMTKRVPYHLKPSCGHTDTVLWVASPFEELFDVKRSLLTSTTSCN